MTNTAEEIIVDLLDGWFYESGKIVALLELRLVDKVVVEALTVLHYLSSATRNELLLVGLSLSCTKHLYLLGMRVEARLLGSQLVA